MVRQTVTHRRRSSREVFSVEADRGSHSPHPSLDPGRLPTVPEHRTPPPRLSIPPPPPSNLLRRTSDGFRPISNYWEVDRSSPVSESPTQTAFGATIMMSPTTSEPLLSPSMYQSATLPRLSLLASRSQVPFPIPESTTKFEVVAERSDESSTPNTIKSLDALLKTKKNDRISAFMPFADLHRIVGAEISFIGGRPLVTRKRKLLYEGTILREDANDKGNRHFLLFNDILVSGSYQNSSSKDPSTCAPLENQIIVSLKNMKTEIVEGLPHLRIETFKERYELHFPDISTRDQWHLALKSATTSFELNSRKNQRFRYGSKRYSSTVNEVLIRSWSTPATQNSITSEFKDGNYSLYDAMHYLSGIKIGIGSLRGSFRGDPTNSFEQNGIEWVPDAEATVCMVCKTTKFNVLIRKHHCRNCGRVICYKCSLLCESSPLMSERLTRVCKECAAKGKRDSAGEWID